MHHDVDWCLDWWQLGGSVVGMPSSGETLFERHMCQAFARATKAVRNPYASAFVNTYWSEAYMSYIHAESYQRGQSICNLNLSLIPI